MADIFSKKKRSLIMSRISGKDTHPEILVRKFLFSEGFRYRKNHRGLKGKPDIVLKKYNALIFVNGCFWHGHSCKAAKLPKTGVGFWKKKIDGNIVRDKKLLGELRRYWNVIVIWQCELKKSK